MGKKGSAGNHGEKIRSDCRVQIEIKASGGLKTDLDSKVRSLYGKSILDLVQRMLKHFGIGHANLVIRDSGALEFVLAARIEAAVRKATGGDKPFLLPALRPDFPESARDRFRITRLYLPGNTPAMMLNAGIHKPDGIILDLEDSVAPSAKEEARILVRNALRSVDFYGAERMVRINPLPEGMKDLEAVLPQQPDLILVPKAEDPGALKQVENKILETSPEREIYLVAILESALGIERAYEIASSSPLLVAMAIGLEDYTADLGVQRTAEGWESYWARSRMVNACRAAGIQALDSVYSDVADQKGLRETVLRSRNLGFDGMGSIHPAQIPIIAEAFRPSEEELEKARAVVDAYREAEKKGLGVISLGTKMIDPPVVKRAQRILALADRVSPKN